jgi:hypothetical protein
MSGEAPQLFNHPDVVGLRALWALAHFKLDFLILGQRLVATVVLDVAGTNIHMLRPDGRNHEAESLGGIEELNRALHS